VSKILKSDIPRLLPVYFLPPLEWWLFNQDGTINLSSGAEKYRKKQFYNRCLFQSNSGIQLFSIPLRKGKTTQECREVQIADDEDWKKKLLQMMQTLYGKSPFYKEYIENIHEVLSVNHLYLYKFNSLLIQEIASILQISLLENADSEATVSVIFPDDSPQDQIIWIDPYLRYLPESFMRYQKLTILDLIFYHGPSAAEFIQYKTHVY